jgi:hypothetical protein
MPVINLTRIFSLAPKTIGFVGGPEIKIFCAGCVAPVVWFNGGATRLNESKVFVLFGWASRDLYTKVFLIPFHALVAAAMTAAKFSLRGCLASERAQKRNGLNQ